MGGSHTHSRTRANGGVISTPGSEFDGYARNRTILGKFGRTAKRSHFGPPRPPESDSRPGFCTERTEHQLIWSILQPFGEDFLPNQAKSEPTNLGEPGYGFFFFFQAEDGIRDRSPSRGLGDVYKRQIMTFPEPFWNLQNQGSPIEKNSQNP